MKIVEARFHASSARWIGGKKRPTSFEAYCLTSGRPRIPKALPYRTVRHGRGTLYFREHEGFADFFFYDPRDEHGYGGAVFTGVTEDGKEFGVKGPWSSSCATVNALGLPSEMTAHIAILDEGDKCKVYSGCAVVLSVLRLIEQSAPDWRLEIPSGPLAPPRNSDLSDQQAFAVDGAPPAVPAFVPVRDFEDCPGCEGRGFNPGAQCIACMGSGKHRPGAEEKCYRCSGRGFETVSCEVCGRRFCASGVAPYPGLVLS